MDEQVQEAPAADEGQTSEQQQVQEKVEQAMRRLKIDGEEKEIPEEQVLAAAQKWLAGDNRLQKAAEERKTVDQYMKEIEAFKKDPKNALKTAGLNPVEIAQAWLREQEEYEAMDEHQRENLTLKQKLAELEQRLEEEGKSKKEQQQQLMRQRAATEIDKEIGEALKEIGRKPTPRLVARLAETMIANLRTKGSRMPAKDALTKAESQLKAETTEWLEQLPPEDLLSFLPKKVVEAIRKSEVERVKKSDPMGKKFESEVKEKVAPKKEKRLSTDDWFKKKEEYFNRRAR